MLLDNLGTAKWPITLHSGEGALLWDTDGNTYWDFYGGHAVTVLGQGHPTWVQAMTRQMQTLCFATTVADVAVRTRAASALCDFAQMDCAFFVNSGAEANEAALKVARKATGRSVIVAMEMGFHGRTMGALGATWKYREQHSPTHGTTRFVPFGDLDALAAALDGDVAAVLTEPIQGIAGIVTPPKGWLKGVEALVRANGSVLICDEVQSGIGRTGKAMAFHAEDVQPDLVTVGKGLGAGFPVAALLLSAEMAATVQPGEHGTTFGGAPLGCAAVEATLEIIAAEGLLARSQQLGDRMMQQLAVPGVTEIRGGGVWVGLVLDRPAKPVAAALRKRGFLVGTASDPKVLRLAPPAVLPEYAIGLLSAALRDVLVAPAQQHTHAAK